MGAKAAEDRQTKIEKCTPKAAHRIDAVTPLYVDGSALAIEVQYPGGCGAREVKLCYSEAFAEGSPPEARVWLEQNDGKNASCHVAWLGQAVYDLAPLRDSYEALCPTGPKALLLNVGVNQVLYDF